MNAVELELRGGLASHTLAHIDPACNVHTPGLLENLSPRSSHAAGPNNHDSDCIHASSPFFAHHRAFGETHNSETRERVPGVTPYVICRAGVATFVAW
ncbi:MAG: hypothetical protein NVS2B16_21240 [Chloroflexota bacterium]